MRRALLLVVVSTLCLVAWPQAPVARAQLLAPLSADLESLLQTRSEQRARVIVHGDLEAVQSLAARHAIRIVRVLEHEIVVEAAGPAIEALAADARIEHLSGDLLVRSAMTVSNKSTAADRTRAGASGLLGLTGIPGVTGKGIGIALLDSGISAHKALGTRVVASVNFVSRDQRTSDAFGHGTHIAGLITGNGSAATSVTNAYSGGIAPGAHLVNVRVLGPDGTGLTSDVIAGIDWVIANARKYNIRVINLSLGHAVVESASTDPLCEAVERAVRAGIVVIASAGNRGKTDEGQPILGGVTSPGNSPYAITVGALNTWSTVDRSDDTVTTYSSRGPTRFDFAVKPDLVAPGNKVVSLEASGSYLASAYPASHVAGSGSNGYMRLSGSSMATGIVSGGVALLLEGTPRLTPQQLKLLLQTGSSYLVRDGLVAGGAGSMNLWSSRQAEENGLQDLLVSLPVLNDVVAAPGGIAFWDTGTMSERIYEGTGIRLLGVFDLFGALLSPSRLAWDTLHLVGANNPLASTGANHIIWGDVAYWTNSNHIIWGDSLTSPEGQHIIWGDSQTTEGYHIIWGDTVAGVGDQ